MSAAALATLGAGFLSSAGSVYTNAINAANAAKINKDNIALQYAINADQIEAARMNNQTAIDLANTAHQREVRDLRDAGLNPILSTHGSGADSPSLQAPSLDAPSNQRYDQVNPLSGVASAIGQAITIDDAHKTAELQRKVINAGLPNNPNVLGQQAESESLAAISQARAAKSAADYEAAINKLKLAMISSADYSYDHGILTSNDIKHLNIDKTQLYELLKEGTISDLKLGANANWQRNLQVLSGAVNSGVSAAASIKGLRRPVGRETILPNGSKITTKELFK